MKMLQQWSARALAGLRIATGLLFLEAGLVKLAQFPAPSGDEPHPFPTLLVAAGCLEVAGGSLVTLGLLTRPTAFLLCGEMAIAYFRAHAPKSFWPSINGGSAAILFCFIFLHLTFAGAGAWSLDGRLNATGWLRRAPRAKRPTLVRNG
jgi:putative oxidoreductase